MGATLSHLFIPLDQLSDLYKLPEECLAADNEFPLQVNFFGCVQLAFLGCAYAMVLSKGSNLIADGSELLLLVPSVAPIIGSVVLPVLGAVPDGCIVLFSGLGPKETVKTQLAVGVGALAGSTVQLLTVPWFLSIIAGRVNLDGNGKAVYRRIENDEQPEKNCFTEMGVQAKQSTMKSATFAMLISTIPYFLIQGSVAVFNDESESERSHREGYFALAGLVACVILLIGYIIHNVRGDEARDAVVRDLQDDVRLKAIQNGEMTLEGAFFHALRHQEPELLRQQSIDSILRSFDTSPRQQLLSSPHQMQPVHDDLYRFRSLLKKFFRRYDRDGSNSIDVLELNLLLQDLGLKKNPSEVDELLKDMDFDNSGSIEFAEFIIGMAKLVQQADLKKGKSIVQPIPTSRQGRRRLVVEQSSITTPPEVNNDSLPPERRTDYGTLEQPLRVMLQRHSESSQRVQYLQLQLENEEEDNEEDEEEEVDMPEDLANLSPQEQQRRIIYRSVQMMSLGSLLVILFSDPLVDVLSQLGTILGVKGFYISFVLAPLASNASEFIAAYNYAKKKTSKSITISLSTLLGGAVLNNTFVMGIFLALVKFRHLEWTFTAETLAILSVELMVGLIALKKVQTVRMAFFTLSLFPLAMVLVAVLENVVGLD